MHDPDDLDINLMHQTFFQLVINGSRLSDKDKEIAYRILVDEEHQSDVLKEENVTRQMWYKIVKLIERETNKLCEEHNLDVIQVVVDKTEKKTIQLVEDKLLSSILESK